MPVETHLDRARERVAAERDRVADERRAYDRFRSRVADIEPAEAGGSGVPTGGAGPASRVLADGGDTARCRRVREAFAETVGRRVSPGPEPSAEPLCAELGEGVALALADRTDRAFTPPVKQATLSAATERRAGAAATVEALDREGDSLAEAAADVTAVTDWLVAADETPLSALGFDALAARHDRLGDHRRRCADRLADRQAVLGTTTSRDATVGVDHRALVESLYEDFPVTYPALATVTQLVELLGDCRRTVRRHLVRRA